MSRSTEDSPQSVSRLRGLARDARRGALAAMRKVSSRKACWNTRLNEREIWQRRERLLSLPREIQVGTNLTCNLRCAFCHREHGEKARLRALPASQREISPRVLDRLVEIAPYLEALRLTPLGEPLLYSGLAELIERLGKLGTANLELTTNGMLMDGRWAQALVGLPARRVYFSIDSADPGLYARMRVGADLARVGEGLDALAQARRAARSTRPEIVVSATLSRTNAEGLADLVRFAAEHGADAVGVQLMEAVAPEFEDDMLDNEPALARRCLAQGREVGRNLGIAVAPHGPFRNLIERETSDSGNRDSTPHDLMDQCSYPWTFLFVDTTGIVRPCCWIGGDYGDLSSDDFDDVWNGPAMRALRRSFAAGRLPQACRDRLCGVGRGDI